MNRYVQAGALNRRVTLQYERPSRSDSGMVTSNWTDEATLWALIRPLTGRELTNAQQRYAQATTEITIRYRRGVTAKKRIVAGKRVYDILHVMDTNDAHYELALVCEERV